jgi:predicted Zn finger-like uncharacterized protein
MITCCPACSTLFKVTPEQLQIAGGRVRCGQCMTVFDARTRMLPADPYVPSDFGWHEEAENSDVLASGLAETVPSPSSQAAAVQSADKPAGTSGAMAPAPQPRRPSPVAEVPDFAPPAFELVPPPAPEEPAAVPVFIGKTSARTVALTASAPGQTSDKAITFTPPPLPIPTRDELDRRHARLIETLARLRENAEQHKNDPDDADTPQAGDDAFGLNVRDDKPDVRPQRGTPAGSVDRDARPREVAADRDRAQEPERKQAEMPRQSAPSGQRPEDGDAKRGQGSWRDEQPDEDEEDLASRPMIDFVLSEIGRSLPSSVLTPFRQARAQHPPEPQAQARPAKPEVPSFIEQARRRAFWALPQVRAGLWAAAALLALMLAAQIAVQQRDRLAAQHPGMRPLLQMLCRPAQCRIAPWRHLDAIAIDSSPVFVPKGTNGFGFAVTLRNNSAVPVATPALELALLDAQGQPLVRRVLNPADWGAPPQLAGYGQFNGAALLTVLDSVHPQAVSTGQLDLFYP